MSLGLGPESNRKSFSEILTEFEADCRLKDKQTLQSMSERLLNLGSGPGITEKGPHLGEGENDVKREIVDRLIAEMP